MCNAIAKHVGGPGVPGLREAIPRPTSGRFLFGEGVSVQITILRTDKQCRYVMNWSR